MLTAANLSLISYVCGPGCTIHAFSSWIVSIALFKERVERGDSLCLNSTP